MSKALKSIHRLIETATKDLPIEQQFLHDLKMGIEKQEQKNARKPSVYYKPSSLKCMRNCYFQRIGVDVDKERADANFVGICESGSDRHLRIQNAISNLNSFGIDCQYISVEDYVKNRELFHLIVLSKEQFETKLFNKKYNLSFMCDGIIKYKKKYYILEIKTESSNKFWSRVGVDEGHYNQAICYSLSFDINEVMFIYESRDLLDKKVYVLQVTDEMKEGIILFIEECDQYVKNMIAPPIPNDLDRKVCNYCLYKNICRGYK